MLALVNIEVKKIKKTTIEIQAYYNVLTVNARISKHRKKHNIRQLIKILKTRNVHAVICNNKLLDGEFITPSYFEYIRLKQADVISAYLHSRKNAPVFINSQYNYRYLENVIKKCAENTSNIYVSPSLWANTVLCDFVCKYGISFLITEKPPATARYCPLTPPDNFEVEVPYPYSCFKPKDMPSSHFAGMLWECTRDKNVADWRVFCH